MLQKMLSVLAVSALLLPASAQVRTQEYLRDLVQLSNVLGGAHAIRVACNGRNDQYWRGHMMNLLNLEAPDRSQLRSSMVDAFNRAYQVESARHPTCDSDAVAAEAAYSTQGREISDRLAQSLLPKKAPSQRN